MQSKLTKAIKVFIAIVLLKKSNTSCWGFVVYARYAYALPYETSKVESNTVFLLRIQL